MADERDLIEILEENNPINIIKYISYVHSPQCSAIATFFGTTRDTVEGKTVLELRYEAYIPMAVRCIKSICTSARSSWNLNSIAVAHRLGLVPVQTFRHHFKFLVNFNQPVYKDLSHFRIDFWLRIHVITNSSIILITREPHTN
ncbi:molybdopterin synthase catalytic subunit, partial [Olea europaea subsp. europaea]